MSVTTRNEDLKNRKTHIFFYINKQRERKKHISLLAIITKTVLVQTPRTGKAPRKSIQPRGYSRLRIIIVLRITF